jgi:hypothetical protein
MFWRYLRQRACAEGATLEAQEAAIEANRMSPIWCLQLSWQRKPTLQRI